MRSLLPIALLFSFALVLVPCARGAAGDAAYVRRTPNEITLGNASIELVSTVDGGQCMASRLLNKLGGDGMPIKSDDFSIGIEGSPPLRAADFAFKDAKDEAIPGGKRLTLHFESAAHGIGLDVVYELGDSDFFLRRRIELTTPKPLDLRQVDAWLVAAGRSVAHQGFGEPVFLDDTFWGLEYPGAHNAYAGGSVRLTQFPGRRVEGRFVSQSAVLGVAEHDRVAQRFLQYVDTFRLHSSAVRRMPLFVNYNTWWTLMPPTEANSLALIELFRQRLYAPYGESFDTFTLDDGWDNKKTLWAIVAERFPRNFAPLLAALRPMHASLGLWLSPSSGYGHAPNLAQQGYEHNSNPWACCQSGPRYRRDIARVVTDLARTYGLAFFKFDGFVASCEATGHGHLPGDYAREANIDAFIELMEAVRRVRPDIYLDPTCGMWLSPWWLRYCDSIWGSVSGDYPDIITPAPIVRDSATTTRDGVFRQRIAEHPGFPPNAIEHLGIIVITPEPWEDDAAAVVGRGCQLLTLYIKPDCFRQGDRDWAFLASLLKWTRHNAKTLEHTVLVGRDPFKREAYGFAHFDGSRGIISLRNPFIEPQTLTLKLDESLGWTRPDGQGSYVARIVYPREETLPFLGRYGDSLEVKLQAYEAMLVHVQASPGDLPPSGVRAHETERAGNRVSYAVYGRPGQKLNAVAAPMLGKASLGGQELTPIGEKGRVLPIAFEGNWQACTIEGARLETREADGSWRIEGSTAATVPAESKAAMHVLFDPRGGSATDVECLAQVGGKPVQVNAVRKPASGEQTHSPHRWTWFEFPLPPGKSDVAITIKPTKSGVLRAEVGWWLWAEHPLKKATLTLEFEKPLPPAPDDPLPLPINMESEREILTIQPARLFNTSSQWPKAGDKVVFLDEIEPDDVTQGWGTLQKKQSVWEKPMTIAGKEFDRGLGTHAPGHIVYDLPNGQFKRFRCLVGRDEHAMDGQIAFEVWLDGKKAFDSGPMNKAVAAKPVDLDITGASHLELRTLDGGDGLSGDHGDWADAQLVR